MISFVRLIIARIGANSWGAPCQKGRTQVYPRCALDHTTLFDRTRGEAYSSLDVSELSPSSLELEPLVVAVP